MGARAISHVLDVVSPNTLSSLQDGRRFNCNMAPFQASAPTAGEIEASRSCVALRPAASASVIEAIANVQGGAAPELDLRCCAGELSAVGDFATIGDACVGVIDRVRVQGEAVLGLGVARGRELG
jgi:hypothetical protein